MPKNVVTGSGARIKSVAASRGAKKGITFLCTHVHDTYWKLWPLQREGSRSRAIASCQQPSHLRTVVRFEFATLTPPPTDHAQQLIMGPTILHHSADTAISVTNMTKQIELVVLVCAIILNLPLFCITLSYILGLYIIFCLF